MCLVVCACVYIDVFIIVWKVCIYLVFNALKRVIGSILGVVILLIAHLTFIRY